MCLVMASLAEILQIIMIESYLRIIDVRRSDCHLVMDDIPESMMASLTQPAIHALPLGYVRGPASSPCP